MKIYGNYINVIKSVQCRDNHKHASITTVYIVRGDDHLSSIYRGYVDKMIETGKNGQLAVTFQLVVY